MKILNLTDLSQSDIKYRIDKFPDGQQNVIINPNFISGVGLMPSVKIDFFDIPTYQYPIQIKSRLNNFKDLELIIAATVSLKELGIKEIHLFTPYFLGSRSDRKFENGGNNYLKDVICPIINSLKFESVTVVDPHSNVLEACLSNFKKIDNKQLVMFALAQIAAKSNKKFSEWNFDDIIIVSPDAGASHKIYKLAEVIGYKGDIITCSKERNIEGKLTKTVVSVYDNGETNTDFIIIDDICDGGRTFINIAKEIKNYFNHEDFDGYQPKIFLIVTHGIFSAGFKELNKYFDGIYCTNSYSNIGDYTGNDMEKTNVKQLNIFN
jgi:ribose-phosphate pyrophosphokinase